MNEIECNEIYESLVNILNQNGLGWVTAQVAEEVRSGKTIEKEIETLRESRDRRVVGLFPAEDFPTHLKRGPKATFPLTVEYQPCEKLHLLINAIEQAIVHTAEMEQHLFKSIAIESPNIRAIQFSSEEPESQPITLDQQNSISRFQSSMRLKELLDDLRKEV